MAVFEVITQHESLRSALRHLVYDSTVFEQYDEKDYLCLQLTLAVL